jgi:hypothetical protein
MPFFYHGQKKGEKETDFVHKLIHANTGNHYNSGGSISFCMLLCKAKAVI